MKKMILSTVLIASSFTANALTDYQEKLSAYSLCAAAFTELKLESFADDAINDLAEFISDENPRYSTNQVWFIAGKEFADYRTTIINHAETNGLTTKEVSQNYISNKSNSYLQNCKAIK